jgi:hypothetical protein
MWYLVLLFSLEGYANRCSEECFLYGSAKGTVDELMEFMERAKKVREPLV